MSERIELFWFTSIALAVIYGIEWIVGERWGFWTMLLYIAVGYFVAFSLSSLKKKE